MIVSPESARLMCYKDRGIGAYKRGRRRRLRPSDADETLGRRKDSVAVLVAMTALAPNTG